MKLSKKEIYQKMEKIRDDSVKALLQIYEKELGKQLKKSAEAKVYCCNCSYFYQEGTICSGVITRCDHPTNKYFIKNTWLCPITKVIWKPHKKNKYNNCPLYERKKDEVND